MGVLLSQGDFDRTNAAVLDFERNPRRPRRPRGGKGGNRPPIRGILLEDLVDGGQADVAITTLDETTYIQEIEIFGDVGGGTFTLTFQGQTTVALAWNSTPAQVQAALENLTTIGKGNVLVRLGKQTYQNFGAGTSPVSSPGIWLVEFVGTFALSKTAPALMTLTNALIGTNPPPVGAATGLNAQLVNSTTHWIDTGAVETVSALIPVGTPTPMREGAVVVGIFLPGVGFGVIACEPREFFESYY